MPLLETTSGASRGGYQGIKKVRGLLAHISDDPVDPPDGWQSTKQLVEVKLEDATVLEMFDGEDMFELTDGKFSFYVPYAEKGKTPNANSIYVRCWIASAEECGFKPSQMKGKYVTLEKQPRILFQKPKIGEDKKPILGPDGKKIYEDVIAVDKSGRPNHFCFVKEVSASDPEIKDYVKSQIVGKNEQSALRELMVNPRIKPFPAYKDMLKAGTIAKELGLEYKDDKFVEAS